MTNYLSQINYNNADYNIYDSNALHLEGGTVSGGIALKDSNADITVANNNLSSNIYQSTSAIVDKNDQIIAKLEGNANTNGKTGSSWYIQNYVNGATKKNIVSMTMDKSGNVTYRVDEPAAFRDAIDVTVNDWARLTGAIERGTTGEGTAITEPWTAFAPWGSNNTLFVIAGLCPNWNTRNQNDSFEKFTLHGTQGIRNNQEAYGIKLKQPGSYLISYTITASAAASSGIHTKLLEYKQTSGGSNQYVDVEEIEPADLFTGFIRGGTSEDDAIVISRTAPIVITKETIIMLGLRLINNSTRFPSTGLTTASLQHGWHSLSAVRLS